MNFHLIKKHISSVDDGRYFVGDAQIEIPNTFVGMDKRSKTDQESSLTNCVPI